MSKKPTVLLIEAHAEPEKERENLQAYFEWLSPHFDITHIHVNDMRSVNLTQDCVVVTGSRWQIATDPVPEALTRLYQTTKRPLLGVCWGHQTLASAWGAKVIQKAEEIKGNEVIHVLDTGDLLEGMGLHFTAHQSHYEHVVRDHNLRKNFRLLADSASSQVEAIKHQELPLWGVQFHPERSAQSGKLLAANFARMVLTFETTD